MGNLEGQNTRILLRTWRQNQQDTHGALGTRLSAQPALLPLLLLFGGSHQYAAFSVNPTSPPCLEWYIEECAGNSSRCSSMMSLTTKILTFSYPQYPLKRLLKAALSPCDRSAGRLLLHLNDFSIFVPMQDQWRAKTKQPCLSWSQSHDKSQLCQ